MRTPSTIASIIHHRQTGWKKIMTDPHRSQSLYALARTSGDPQRILRRIRSGKGNWKSYRHLLTFLDLWTKPDRIRALSCMPDTDIQASITGAESLKNFLLPKIMPTFDPTIDYSPFQL
jgi:hypothetical protein